MHLVLPFSLSCVPRRLLFHHRTLVAPEQGLSADAGEAPREGLKKDALGTCPKMQSESLPNQNRTMSTQEKQDGTGLKMALDSK